MTEHHTLSYKIKVQDLEREAREFAIEATEQERAEVADRFNLISVESLKGTVSVRDKGEDIGIYLSGELSAKFTQRCIVSLQPVEESLETSFELMLVDPETADRMDDEGVYLDPDAPDYDALEGNEIPLGEILAQTLSISMNPYPRAEDAELSVGQKQGVSLNEPELERPNPFAVLAKTRDES